MSIDHKLDYDVLVEYEKYQKLVEQQLGYLEAIKFEKFVETLWLSGEKLSFHEELFENEL